jgi:PAS domain-containing protein
VSSTCATAAPPVHRANTRQLRQIVAGLGEGVILISPEGEITWANEAALRMHGAEALADLGEDAAGYRRSFALRYRNNHPLEDAEYPIDRAVAGEAFAEVVVEVTPEGAEQPEWVHSLRSLILTEEDGTVECWCSRMRARDSRRRSGSRRPSMPIRPQR